MNKTYVAIDLKSFYASVECVERGLDPLNTNLVVADTSRTQKTICLAVSPSLKTYGIPGRARLFEVIQKVKEINYQRKLKAPKGKLISESHLADELQQNPTLALGYIAAPPRMALYMEYSTRIYNVYLKYIAPEDIHVYSIDEVFIDVTSYLNIYKQSAEELTKTIILDVLQTTGITATAGIGTNLFLCKVAMDIMAKRIPADKDGVRIAFLDETIFKQQLWSHKPLTDFWRIGKGYAKKLEDHHLLTMGDIARCSLGDDNDYHNEALLYKLFGVNAELLIDHAWGYEPCTIQDIKSYVPNNSSLGSGQVLHEAYSNSKARIIVQEMIDQLVLDLVEKKLVTNQIVLTVGYDIENLTNDGIANSYTGEITTDYYGRQVPKHAHGTANLETYSSSTKLIMEAVLNLYDHITNKALLVRRINLSANHIQNESIMNQQVAYQQLDLFTNYEELEQKEKQTQIELEKEKKLQKAVLEIKKKHGKNSLLKGMNLQEGATTKERNNQIGGHKA